LFVCFFLDMTPEERITELRTALLRVTSQVLQLSTAIDRVAESLDTAIAPNAAAATSTSVDTTQQNEAENFQQNILIYAQRRAARRALRNAIHAGALIPRDDLGFTVEQPSSDDEIDILRLRLAPGNLDEGSETSDASQNADPLPDAPTAASPRAAARNIVRNPNQPVSARTTRQRRREHAISADWATARRLALIWHLHRIRVRNQQRDELDQKPAAKRR
jgi:hypothetical protein